MDLLKNYLELEQKIYDYFGFTESFKSIVSRVIYDCRDYFWHITSGTVRFAGSESDLLDDEYSESDIITSIDDNGGVYRTSNFTIIYAQMDGRDFLHIFNNTKEIK